MTARIRCFTRDRRTGFSGVAVGSVVGIHVHPLRMFVCFIGAMLVLNGGSSDGQQRSPARAPAGPIPAEMLELLNMELPTSPSAVIAVVGKSPVLLGELMPQVETRIAAVLEKAGQTPSEMELKIARINLLRQYLSRAIQQKQMRESFVLEQVATEAADKRQDASDKMTAKARQYFFEEQLPKLKSKYKLDDLAELDAKLREEGTSLKAQRREFVDDMLGQLYLSSKINRKPEIPLGDQWAYYQQNKEDYHQDARARWEQLTVLKANFPTHEGAKKEISSMASEAYYGGSMEGVARARSQEPFASDGGVHDWTTFGSLRSKPLEQKIFSLPLNRMSELIEDDEAIHVIRVLEREAAGYTPFAEVQDEIKSKLQRESMLEQQEALIAELARRVPVWSLFPKDTPGAKPLQDNQVIRR